MKIIWNTEVLTCRGGDELAQRPNLSRYCRLPQYDDRKRETNESTCGVRVGAGHLDVAHQPPATAPNAKRLACSGLARPQVSTRSCNIEFATDDNPTTNTQVSRQHRQHAYLRRFLQRSKDLPGQGALHCPSTSRRPPPRCRNPAIATATRRRMMEHDNRSDIC